MVRTKVRSAPLLLVLVMSMLFSTVGVAAHAQVEDEPDGSLVCASVDDDNGGVGGFDDFDGDALDDRWTVIEPELENLSVADGRLSIQTVTGRDFFAGQGTLPNVVVQELPDGAWTATTEMEWNPAQDFQNAGMVVFDDEDNYLKFGLVHAGGKAFELIKEIDGGPDFLGNDGVGAAYPAEFLMRMVFDGDVVTAQHSVDGEQWDTVGTADLSGLEGASVGVYATNSQNAGATNPPVAHFDSFSLESDEEPVEPPVTGVFDDFEGDSLDDRWTVIESDPENLSVADGRLSIQTQVGFDFHANGGVLPNVVVQEMPDGAWTATTEIEWNPTQNFQNAGMVVYVDEANYIKAGMVHAGGRAFEMFKELGNNPQNQGNASIPGDFPENYLMRLVYDGATLTAEFSADGSSWTAIGTTNLDGLEGANVGVYATNSTSGDATNPPVAHFDSFALEFESDEEPVEPPVSGVFDDFEGDSLDGRWTVIEPELENLSVADGRLSIQTVTGRDFFAGDGTLPNVVIQELPDGAWTATTEMEWNPAQNFQNAGMVVFDDEDNYLKFGLVHAGGKAIELIKEINGSASFLGNDGVGATYPAEFLMRMVFDGDVVTAQHSVDGEQWDTVGTADLSGLEGAGVGVYATNSTNTGATNPPVAHFDSFALEFETDDDPADPQPVERSVSDEFDGDELDGCRWDRTVRYDADTLEVSDGWLRVQTSPEDIHGPNNGAPTNFVLQDMPDGDWTVETHMDAALERNWQNAGFMVYQDDDNYLKTGIVALNQPGQTRNLELEMVAEADGDPDGFNNPLAGDLNANDEWYLRLAKVGDVYTTSWSVDGEDFQELSQSRSIELEDPAFGLYAVGTGQQQTPVEVAWDYFRLLGEDDEPDAIDVQASLDPADPSGTNGWYVDPVTVSLSSDTDDAILEWRLAGAEDWITWTEPVTLDQDDVYDLEYRARVAVDGGDDLVSAIGAATIQLDQTPPETTATVGGDSEGDAFVDEATVTLDAADDLSGVAETHIREAGVEEFDVYDAPVSFTGAGSYTIEFRSADVAGNAEEWQSTTFEIVEGDGPGDGLICEGDRPELHSDEFEGDELDGCRWDRVVRYDPTMLRVEGGQLLIDTPEGDIYQTPNGEPENFVLQTQPDGDWTVETRFTEELVSGYSQAGLMVYVDDDNYVKWDTVADVNQEGVNRVELRSEVDGLITNPQPTIQPVPDNDGEWWLRLSKEGDSFTGSVSVDGENWTDAPEPVTNAAVASDGGVGVFTLAVQDPSTTVAFDYFRVLGEEVTDPDPDPDDPTVEVSLDPAAPDGNDGWYVSPVTISLSSDDDDATLQWRLAGDTDWITWTGPVTVDTDGVYDVEYRAVGAEATSPVGSASFSLDQTPPETSASVDGPTEDGGMYTADATVTLVAQDATSGVAETHIREAGDADFDVYVDPVAFTADGDYTVEYRSADVAGNVEDWQTVTFTIDRDAEPTDPDPTDPDPTDPDPTDPDPTDPDPTDPDPTDPDPTDPTDPTDPIDRDGTPCERAQGGASFPDAPGSGHRQFIDCLLELGIVEGYTDGTFGPADDVSRGQLASFVVRAVETAMGETMDSGGWLFPDVGVNSTHAQAIYKLRNAGIIQGFEDGTFRPGASVTRDQTARYVVGALEFVLGEDLPTSGASFPDVAAGSRYASDIDKLVTAGVVSGFTDGTFGPRAPVTRGQMARFIGNSLEVMQDAGAYVGP